MPTRQLHIEGVVQGVGFRPHVFRLANEHRLKGWVSNDVGGVHIEVTGTEGNLGRFEAELLSHPPHLARISRVRSKEVPEADFITFQIIESNPSGKPTVMVTPDLGLCDDCKHELSEAGNRREGYPFTTCLKCGPRYSIIHGLPYDRPLTTMSKFTMCPVCEKEYHNPLDRRFYSQTNSCPDCAVELSLVTPDGKILNRHAPTIIQQTAELFRQGAILAVKGIGGYLLMTDASNHSSVDALRYRKNRPAKPFAVLMKDIAAVRQYAEISEAEAVELRSLQSPVVLLKKKSPASLPGIAPGLDRLGVMLPYTPLLALIADAFNGPLVATSGNISGSPIFYDDAQALNNLGTIADFFLVNNREIVVPQDDSVVQYSRYNDQRIVVRRSRGLAPLMFQHPFDGEEVLAMGADMKSAFALNLRGNLYASQYLGDLENFDTQHAYQHTLHHLLNLVQAKPTEVVIDKHPGYFSTQAGKKLAKAWGVAVREVQHHHAHFGAVLAENNRLDSPTPILGVIWDGTGLGDDSNIWGGEFFRYQDNTFERVAHLDCFPHILGDKFSREPRLSALALALGQPGGIGLVENKFNDSEWKLYTALIANSQLQTSSVGRLFDGVASLLGLCDHATYEGEAAMYLETCARRDNDHKLEPIKASSTARIIQEVIHQINLGSPRSAIAYQFHVNLVQWIRLVALQQDCRTLAFSGGVFQNALLVDLIITLLGDEFELLFHRELSPNDECISYGQLACRQIEKKRIALTPQTETLCASPSPVN